MPWTTAAYISGPVTPVKTRCNVPRKVKTWNGRSVAPLSATHENEQICRGPGAPLRFCTRDGDQWTRRSYQTTNKNQVEFVLGYAGGLRLGALA